MIFGIVLREKRKNSLTKLRLGLEHTTYGVPGMFCGFQNVTGNAIEKCPGSGIENGNASGNCDVTSAHKTPVPPRIYRKKAMRQ